MKHRVFTLFTSGILCASLTAEAFAASPTVNTEKNAQISQLEQKAHRLDWDAQATKGSARALREMQSYQVKKLIERLQAGEAVDPQEIDKLLNQQPWPY
jgi:flagellar capping protein FliD